MSLQIEEDFQALYPEQHARFTGCWEQLASKLLQLVKNDAKDDAARKLLEALSDAPEEQRRFATANVVLYLLPNVMPPKPLGKATRNCRRWKPSIAESQEAFIHVSKVGTNLGAYRAAKRQKCQEKGITWQPRIVVLGESVIHPVQVLVLVNDTVYEVGSLIKAVDVCFKAFFVLNADYPPQVRDPWLLLQRGVMGIETEYDTRSARVDEISAFRHLQL